MPRKLPPKQRDCEICGEPMPPRFGPGRPRKSHPECAAGAAYSRPAVVTELDVLGLEHRGRELWDEMAERVPGPLHRTLLLEACRLADRGERMHALLRGERAAWLVLELGDVITRFDIMDAAEIKVSINAVAVEARNTATALKVLISELRQAIGRSASENREDDDPLSGMADEVAAKRRAHGAS